MAHTKDLLIAHLLNQYAEELSNHGCNDLDNKTLELLACLDSEQRDDLIYDANSWNNGNVDLDSPEQMPDWMLANVLAYQLKK